VYVEFYSLVFKKCSYYLQLITTFRCHIQSRVSPISLQDAVSATPMRTTAVLAPTAPVRACYSTLCTSESQCSLAASACLRLSNHQLCCMTSARVMRCLGSLVNMRPIRSLRLSDRPMLAGYTTASNKTRSSSSL
jgi:hypothetical protein